MTNHTAESLLAFRDRVEAAYLDKQIRSPVHFPSTGQAQPLIDIFKEVKPSDWVFSTWRSMFHCLLKGMPEDELFQQYLDGRSMYVCSKEYKVICSSIVGGILPMACGVAMALDRQIKAAYEDYRKKMDEEKIYGSVTLEIPIVYVFVGDMCGRTGLYHEFYQYVEGHGLPVKIVSERNGVSTNANTEETWGTEHLKHEYKVTYHRSYDYERDRPHVGLNQRVSF